MDSLLPMMLDAAVPLWQMRIKERHQSIEDIIEHLAAHAKGLQERLSNEEVLFKSLTPGKTADAFNALAEAIAYLSFMPGGVTCFGRTWVMSSYNLENAVVGE